MGRAKLPATETVIDCARSIDDVQMDIIVWCIIFCKVENSYAVTQMSKAIANKPI